MTTLIRAGAAALFTIESVVSAFAADARPASDPAPVIAPALIEANKAEQERMDAFDTRLKTAADHAIGSICIGCLPGAVATRPTVSVRLAGPARPKPVVARIAEHRATLPRAIPRTAWRLPARLQRLILARFFVPDA